MSLKPISKIPGNSVRGELPEKVNTVRRRLILGALAGIGKIAILGITGCQPPLLSVKSDSGLIIIPDTILSDSRPAIKDIITISDIDPIDALKDRIESLVKKENRLIFFNHKTKVQFIDINSFLTDLIERYGLPGAGLTIDSMEDAIQYLQEIENELKNSYTVSKNFNGVGIEVADSEFGGGHASAENLRIILNSPQYYPKHQKYLKAAIVHEYGHFLYFHRPDGSVIIPPYTESYPIDMAEMEKNGVINRYHLESIYLKPYLSPTLTIQEYNGLTELLAHRVVSSVVSQKEAVVFFDLMLGAFLKVMPNLSYPVETFQLLLSLFLAKQFEFNNHESSFMNKLIAEDKLNLNQIQQSLSILQFFWDSIKVAP